MANTPASRRMSARELRGWRQRLLHGEWRLWDLGFFHVLLSALAVLIALLTVVAVVGMTSNDGNVGVSVGFVASLVAVALVVRGGVRAGLIGAERRTATAAAQAARNLYLESLARGATAKPGAASAFASRSAADIGTYLSRAVPTRAVAPWIPIGVLVVMALIDPWSAAICAAVLVAAPFVLSVLGRRAADEAQVGLSRLRSLSARALELLEGAVELRALGVLERGRDELAAATGRAVESTRRSLRIGLKSSTALDVLAGLGVGLVAMADGFRLLEGSMGLGRALAAVLLVAEVFGPLRAAGAAFHAGADGLAALGVLDQACSEARPAPEVIAGEISAAAATAPAVNARAASMAAAPGGEAVLVDLELSVPSKGAVVISGPSGSGKSTLLRALAGAPLLLGGSLAVGNADPSRFSARQRARLIASVDQRPFLVSGSIRDNVVLGMASPDPTLVDRAVSACGLDAVASRFDRGLDAQVGEEGRMLSAGERTRVVLARAFVRQPGLLLLDEVGAHLDDLSLAGLRSGLAEFLAARTVVEAAHDRPLLASASVVGLARVAP